MKVKLSVVGRNMDRDRPVVTWPEDWPLPQIDEVIYMYAEDYFVRSVSWYPLGDLDNSEPFIYVVIGPRRVTYINS